VGFFRDCSSSRLNGFGGLKSPYWRVSMATLLLFFLLAVSMVSADEGELPFSYIASVECLVFFLGSVLFMFFFVFLLGVPSLSLLLFLINVCSLNSYLLLFFYLYLI
jgi:hypothetical protein